VSSGGVRRVARWLLGLIAVALLLAAVASQWDAVVDGFGQLDPLAVISAFLLVVSGLVANMLSWRAVLAGLGSRLPVPVAGRVYLLAQLGKYLPGSVWPVLAQAELGRDHGVPRLRSGVAAVAALVVGLTVGAVLAAGALAATATAELRSYAWALLVVPAGLVLLHPRVLQWLLDHAMRLMRRESQAHRVDGRALFESVAWSAAMWLLFGAHVWVLAASLGASGAVVPVLSVGAYAAAWVVGFLFVFAPAGAGPREVVLVLALSPVLPQGAALALALTSRALMLLGDLVSVGGAVLWARANRAPMKHAPAAASAEDGR